MYKSRQLCTNCLLVSGEPRPLGASEVAQVAVSEFRCSFSCPYNSQSLLLSGHYCDGNCTPTAVIAANASGEGQLSDISLCLLHGPDSG